MFNVNPESHASRRRFIKFLAAGTLTSMTIPSLIRQALASGRGPQRKQGIYKLEGEASFNGKTQKVGDVLTLPLTVVTGAETLLVFVMGADAYLVRSMSRLVLSASDAQMPSRADSIKLFSGKLLSVFEKSAKKERTLITSTAVAGIRGTGIYLESEAERTYLCLCYGNAKLGPIDAPQLHETINTTHHESPRWVFRDHIKPAKMLNHTDEELIMLESLTGRVPPFSQPWNSEEDKPYDTPNDRY